MIPLDRAIAIVEKQIEGFRPRGEWLPVRRAQGRALLAPARSRLDLPPFDKSAMDGYALAAGDVRDRYRLVRTLAAGEAPLRGRVEPGTAVKVMTGAAVPAGAGVVIPIERTRLEGDEVAVLSRGQDPNICSHGEDVRRGDKVLDAGTTLGPLEVAVLVSCGLERVRVGRRPRIAILATGDEIVDDPARLAAGRIMNSNGPLLAGLARQYCLEVVLKRRVGDDARRTLAAIRTALTGADIVVITGGVSVGDHDYVGAALPRAGLKVHFDKVAVKPGRPMTFATRKGKAVFGLPGNPASAFLMFHVFVLRAAARLGGGAWPVREFVMTLGFDYKRRSGERSEFVPCRIAPNGRLEKVEFHGSAHLSALTQADGFFFVPAGCVMLGLGQNVLFLPVARAWR